MYLTETFNLSYFDILIKLYNIAENVAKVQYVSKWFERLSLRYIFQSHRLSKIHVKGNIDCSIVKSILFMVEDIFIRVCFNSQNSICAYVHKKFI